MIIIKLEKRSTENIVRNIVFGPAVLVHRLCNPVFNVISQIIGQITSQSMLSRKVTTRFGHAYTYDELRKCLYSAIILYSL
jgi:hypothetical protein